MEVPNGQLNDEDGGGGDQDDGGSDAGTERPDAKGPVADGGSKRDAGHSTGADAADADTGTTGASSGGGCSVAGAAGGFGIAWAAPLLAVLRLRRRVKKA
jgi:hypothetical protein